MACAAAPVIGTNIYNKLFSVTVDGVVLLEIVRDRDGGPVDYRFLEVNPAFTRMIGRVSEHLIDKTILEVFPKTGPVLVDSFNQVALSGEPIAFERYSHENGRYFNISVYRLAADLIATVVADMTEKKRAEIALKGSEEKFRTLVESSIDVIFVLDTNGFFKFVSQAWEKHFGFPVSEVLEHSFAPFVHPDDVPLCFEYLVRVMSTGQGATSPPYRVKRADGSWSLFIANGTPYTDEQGNYLYIGVGRDISDQTRAEEERLELERQLLHSQKLESLGILAGGIAHDFNNLLQVILGNLELASTRLSPHSATLKYISHAMHAAKHSADLTSRMLAYSGKGNYVIEIVDLNALVNENVTMLRTAVPKTISIDLHTDTELPPIRADKAQLQQVIMNLITNAAEAIEEQPGLIKLITCVQNCDRSFLADSRLIDKPEPGRFVCLEVSDNGVGMSQETQSCIFDPFFTTKFTGRGLGMSAVQGIIKGHGGALFVESTPGRGTAIKVAFPAIEQEISDNDRKKIVEVAVKSSSSIGPLSGVALIVDDEKPVLRICVSMVKLCGLTVLTANDGADALSKFRALYDEIDLVIMDLTMPNMDGVTAMRELRRIKPDIKIILSSGFNEQELVERICDQAPAGFIRKPYSLKDLEAEIRRVMQG
jgi:PAS domain S-box-containing protein